MTDSHTPLTPIKMHCHQYCSGYCSGSFPLKLSNSQPNQQPNVHRGLYYRGRRIQPHTSYGRGVRWSGVATFMPFQGNVADKLS
jgi:hypothetical protein